MTEKNLNQHQQNHDQSHKNETNRVKQADSHQQTQHTNKQVHAAPSDTKHNTSQQNTQNKGLQR
ncbi:hypothetical protein [Entomobacter blattae]|uniref:Uncharacterized protein n=1 Tax=Entomobacter blattae TaxID=2762277 RepID=A0A7H1NS67_9PROT|nr:hypothetical protein [Entomobacter blattae]QNT78627.1 hypothetical protein JGUZn3_14020 [Entomobacter blattae]